MRRMKVDFSSLLFVLSDSFYRLFADQRFWTKSCVDEQKQSTCVHVFSPVFNLLINCQTLNRRRRHLNLSLFFCGSFTGGVPRCLAQRHAGCRPQIFSPANRCLVNGSPELFSPETLATSRTFRASSLQNSPEALAILFSKLQQQILIQRVMWRVAGFR